MEQSLNLIQRTTYSYTLGTDSFCEERTPRHDWYINDPVSFCLWRIETRQPSFPWSRLPPLRHHAQGPAVAGVTMLIPNKQASWQEWDNYASNWLPWVVLSCIIRFPKGSRLKGSLTCGSFLCKSQSSMGQPGQLHSLKPAALQNHFCPRLVWGFEGRYVPQL